MTVWIQNPFDNLPSEGFRKQRYWLMAEAFARAGHRVVLWTSDFSHARKAKRNAALATGAAEAGFSVEFVPTLPYARNVSIQRIRSHLAYAREWRCAVMAKVNAGLPRQSSPEVIISSCPTLAAAAAAVKLARQLGAKVIVDVQDAWPETFERLAPKGLRWLLRLALWPWRLWARWIYREADLVTGVCDAYRSLTRRPDYYRAYLGIEGGANPAASRRREDSDAKIRLVYAGGLGKTYDLRTLTGVVADNADFTLDIAGFGAVESACPRVKVHGALAQVELEALLATGDIGIIPMADESWVGLPNKIFDYAQAGLAIVSSLAGESEQLLREFGCGAQYRPGDAASLTAAIRRAAALPRGASRQLCESQFEAGKIYADYVRKVENAFGNT